MEHNDHTQTIGRILTRRQALALLGIGGGATLAALTRPGLAQGQGQDTARTLPACIATPEQTEGPYFVDEKLRRSDIRADPAGGVPRPGLPLQLTLQVSQLGAKGCTPLAGAMMDIWHCDAAGLYSDVSDPYADTRGSKFLRGHQITGTDGRVRFTTIYPGWYPGRAVHIHFKVRSVSGAGKGYAFTSQWYFDEAVTDQVHARTLYAAKGRRTLRNEGDGLYRNGGNRLMLALAKVGEGYAGSFHVALTA